MINIHSQLFLQRTNRLRFSFPSLLLSPSSSSSSSHSHLRTIFQTNNVNRSVQSLGYHQSAIQFTLSHSVSGLSGIFDWKVPLHLNHPQSPTKIQHERSFHAGDVILDKQHKKRGPYGQKQNKKHIQWENTYTPQTKRMSKSKMTPKVTPSHSRNRNQYQFEDGKKEYKNPHYRSMKFKTKEQRNNYYRAKSKFVSSHSDIESSSQESLPPQPSSSPSSSSSLPKPPPPPPLPPPKRFRLFASCLPGLEPILRSELEALGFVPKTSVSSSSSSSSKQNNPKFNVTPGGIEFEATNLLQIYQCHLHLGTASHILLRCSTEVNSMNHEKSQNKSPQKKEEQEEDSFTFKARSLPELRRKVSKMACWRYLFHKDHYNNEIQQHTENKSSTKTASSNGSSYYNLPPLSIRVSAQKSKLQHTKAIAERVEYGIADALGIETSSSSSSSLSTNSFFSNEGNSNRNSNSNNTKNDTTQKELEQEESTEHVKILVRIVRDHVQISMDTSSTPLHQRGYRLQPGKAPIREDIAYALLKSCGWPPTSTHESDNNDNNNELSLPTVLLDPFCGSGTIAIEAAAMAHYPNPLPPGRFRSLPLKHTSLGKEVIWNHLLNRHVNANTMNVNKNTHNIRIVASDRDAGSIEIAEANAGRAGVSHRIEFQNCAVSSSPWLQGSKDDDNDDGLDTRCSSSSSNDGDSQTNSSLYSNYNLVIATNPPYGKRISPPSLSSSFQTPEESLLPLYQKFGHQLNKANDPKVALIAKDVNLARRMGLKRRFNVEFVTNHGGLKIAALVNKTSS